MAAASVVVSSLEEINGLVRDPVHQAVFLSDTARPTPGQYKSQRFGLSWAFKGVRHDRLDEIQYPDCSASLGFDPKTQILPELGLKDCNPVTPGLHRGSLASNATCFRASFFLVLPGAAPPEDVERFVVSAAGARFPGGPQVRWPEAKRRRGLPVAGQSPHPAGRSPRRERWRDFDADSYMLFPWASRRTQSVLYRIPVRDGDPLHWGSTHGLSRPRDWALQADLAFPNLTRHSSP